VPVPPQLCKTIFDSIRSSSFYIFYLDYSCFIVVIIIIMNDDDNIVIIVVSLP
jgi:hypothetical protein